MQDIAILSAVRTPIGNIGGTLKNIQPEKLLEIVFSGAIEKAGIKASDIDEVIAGQTKQSTDAPNIARLSSLMAKIPEEIPAYTVHRQCASGLQAIWNGMQAICCGDADVVLAGGVESMSTAPFYIRGARYGVGTGNALLLDPNVESQPRSQPSDIYGTFNMIQTADNVAVKYDVSRQDQDNFALTSQQNAIAAVDSGRFKDEIIPVIIPQKKGEPIIFDTDEYPKRTTNAEKLAKLRTIFKDGTVTAGNASGRNDGAAAVVLASKEKAAEIGIKPMAVIKACTAVGVDPKYMGIGPVPAINKLLKKVNWEIENVDLFEINEAFAAQAVACAKELNLPLNRLNVNGGAIALGHPLGCSGTRIIVTLVHEMVKRGSKRGIAAICVAGGLGMAAAVEVE